MAISFEGALARRIDEVLKRLRNQRTVALATEDWKMAELVPREIAGIAGGRSSSFSYCSSAPFRAPRGLSLASTGTDRQGAT